LSIGLAARHPAYPFELSLGFTSVTFLSIATAALLLPLLTVFKVLETNRVVMVVARLVVVKLAHRFVLLATRFAIKHL